MYSIVGRRSDYEALGEETAQFHTRKVFTEALATLPTEEKIALDIRLRISSWNAHFGAASAAICKLILACCKGKNAV